MTCVFGCAFLNIQENMDRKTTLPSHSKSYDEKMKEVLNNLCWSKRLFNFLALTVIVNIILTYGLIFHPPPPSLKTCAEFIKAQYPQLLLPTTMNVGRSVHLSLNDVVAQEDLETTALAVRSTGVNAI